MLARPTLPLLLLLQGCATLFCDGNFWINPAWVGGQNITTADMTVCQYTPPGNRIDWADGGAKIFGENVGGQGILAQDAMQHRWCHHSVVLMYCTAYYVVYE
jgi:hypothetical protein